jgi:polyisoprenyl-phosphate glycosyltransferase
MLRENSFGINEALDFRFFGAVCLAIALISIAGGLVYLASAFFLGVGAILLAILICAMGLLAVLLKQIMNQA